MFTFSASVSENTVGRSVPPSTETSSSVRVSQNSPFLYWVIEWALTAASMSSSPAAKSALWQWVWVSSSCTYLTAYLDRCFWARWLSLGPVSKSPSTLTENEESAISRDYSTSICIVYMRSVMADGSDTITINIINWVSIIIFMLFCQQRKKKQPFHHFHSSSTLEWKMFLKL